MLAPGRGCAELRAQDVDALVQRPPLVRQLPFDASVQGEAVGRRLPRRSTAGPGGTHVNPVVQTLPLARELTLATLEQSELAGQSIHVLSPLRPHPLRVHRHQDREL